MERRDRPELAASRGRQRSRRLRSRALLDAESSADVVLRPLLAVTALVDGDGGGHLARVGGYAALLARSVGLDDDESRAVATACLLHDIGKVGIPDAILAKPGALDAGERSEMQRHAEIGHRILGGSELAVLELAADVALTHHEWYDGSGYPCGLARDEIPLAGRIAAVADVFDALTSDRVYRAALPVAETVSVMGDGEGSQFDPDVLEALFRAVEANRLGDSAQDAGGSGPLGSTTVVTAGSPGGSHRTPPDR